MKFNFKKISAVAISTLLTGMTMGVAAAASYPAPFVSGGVANTAVVYGTGQGVSDLDRVYGGNIQTDLQTYITSSGGSVTTVTGGELFKLEKSSDKFNFNESLNGVYADLDADDMDFLADGTYDDGDVDEDYEQKITLGTKTLSLFADTDYENDEPTVGFKFDNGDTILSYEIEFDDVVNPNDMVDTDMPIMGKTYYVLAASATQIDLLDSADKVTIAEGETVEVKGKQISIEYIDTTDVKLSIDGESIAKLEEHEYEELSDGSYVIINENLYASKETGISKATISIGSGKLELISGSEVELNDEDVDGLEATIAGNVTKVTLTWKSDRETFLTEGNAITMPVFDDLSLSYGGLTYDSDSEIISFENGETFTIVMDNYEIPVLWYNGTFSYLGEEDYLLVIATSNITNATWNTPNLNLINASASGNSSLTGGLVLEEDDRFIVTRIDTDLADVETMYYQVNTVENESTNEVLVELEDLIGDKDITFDALEDDEVGDITIQLVAINGTTSGQAYINFSAGGDTITYNKLVSDKGLIINIPTTAADDANGAGATLTMTEADKDEDVGQGAVLFKVIVKNNTNDKLHVSTQNVTVEEESDDNDIGVVPSDLASKITFDHSADEYDYSIEYTGKEAVASVNVVYGGSIETEGGTSTGVVMVTDAEVSSVSSKNLIIVGGSCINSAAAKVLGGAYCGAAFTASTGVGSGQFLIKSVSGAYTSGKLALVVAGYESADTVNAVQYLINKKPDTSKNYKGTSATVASEIVTTA